MMFVHLSCDRTILLAKSEQQDSSVGRTSDWKARCSTDVGLISSQFSAQTHLQCLYSPHVQLHASESLCVCVCVVKIPNTGIHTIDWTHDILIGMCSAAHAAPVGLPREGDPDLPQEIMRYYIKERKKERKKHKNHWLFLSFLKTVNETFETLHDDNLQWPFNLSY